MTNDNSNTSVPSDTGSAETSKSTDSTSIDPSENALPAEDLQYPEFTFEDGSISPDGSFDLERTLKRDEMGNWLSDLAGGLTSHDIAVESSDRHVTFGIRPDAVSMAFEPDDDHRGKLKVSFELDAKVMLAQDADSPKIGARAGRGFVPVEMLTTDRKPEHFRCYNWIENPVEEE
ncbi:hypothetical protein [Haladaptatus sp. DFWS20]|uniref:hypothetical protein n=1 Tax=Haladaptatus sp. DFWS20 TaxID=3403467 RepID=UPI003EB8BA6F